MQAHEHHFPIATTYKMNPSRPTFSRLLALTTAQIYIVGLFCDRHVPYLVALMRVW
jgi:hypothetical protein